jgi:DNA-binding LytR/AlgR family response regulator
MGYKVAASRYIQKGKEKKEIEELINEVYENKYSPSYFTFIAGAHTYRLRIKDIVAMETVERKVEITTTDGLFYFSGTLTELLGELPANYFTKCHQAFAVNMNQMREIERLDLIASNGKRIPISRPYLNDVKSAFMKRVKNI